MRKYLLIVLSLILVGVLLVLSGISLSDGDEEKELFQKYQETINLYEKTFSLEGEERTDALTEVQENFIEIALTTRDEKLAAIAFYDQGTIWLGEFLKDKNNVSNLKRAILSLQESLRRNPGLEGAKRNLERAWREVEEKGLMDEFERLTEGEGQEASKDSCQVGGEGEEEKTKETEEGGIESTDRPLPYSDDDGYGRGKERDDY